jgi:hypothetical protein
VISDGYSIRVTVTVLGPPGVTDRDCHESLPPQRQPELRQAARRVTGNLKVEPRPPGLGAAAAGGGPPAIKFNLVH